MSDNSTQVKKIGSICWTSESAKRRVSQMPEEDRIYYEKVIAYKEAEEAYMKELSNKEKREAWLKAEDIVNGATYERVMRGS